MGSIMKRIPFIPLKLESMKKVARHYIGLGEALSRLFPSMEFNLKRAELDFEPREWMSITISGSIFYFVIITSLLLFIAVMAEIQSGLGIMLCMGSGLAMGGSSFMYLIFYPRLLARKRIRELEMNLSYALHHLLIHVRSGVPLFNAMISISRGNYGVLSKEFERLVREIDTGKSEIEALEMLARNNPSLYLRRITWQMVNAMKSGADIGRILKEIVENMAEEQRIAIKKYGSELNPLALFYMLLVVIFPTLGIIFLLVLFSFVGGMIEMELLLVAILMLLVVVQVMFIGIVKTKRPMGV